MDNSGYSGEPFNHKAAPTETRKPDSNDDTMFIDKDDVHVEVESDLEYESNYFTRTLERMEDAAHGFHQNYYDLFVLAFKIILLLAYFVYFGFAMAHEFGDEGSIMLLVITIFLVLVIIMKTFARCGYLERIINLMTRCWTVPTSVKIRRVLRRVVPIAMAIFIIVFLILDILRYHTRNLQSLYGIAAFIFISLLLSVRPSRINWYTIFWGLVVQFVLAYLVMNTDPGYDTFHWIGDAFTTVFSWSDSGGKFFFGEPHYDFTLAFQFAAIIIFFSTLINVLIHLGVIDFFMIKVGMFVSMCMETNPVESVVSIASIFVGPAEIAMMLKPYMRTLTLSELHCVMCCGFASISGPSLAFLISIGAPANHLLTAAVISAPAGLVIAKIMYPETKKADTEKQKRMSLEEKRQESPSVIAALANGAAMSVPLAGAVLANMIAFYSLMHMLNVIVHWMGERVGSDRITIQYICSYLLYPIPFFMGIDPDDCRPIGALIGIKYLATPLVSYYDLIGMIRNRLTVYNYAMNLNATSIEDVYYWHHDDVYLIPSQQKLRNGFISERSEVIGTYALAGFSAITTIAVTMGAMIQIGPTRKKDLLKVIMRAFIAGNIASFFTGAVAGLMYTD